MREDLRAGQVTENPFMYGHVKVAKQAGIAIPNVQKIYDLITLKETGVDISDRLDFCSTEE